MTNSFNHLSLKRWFLTEARDLPWRNKPTPYGVWISEMMLQQTQAAVVAPYFLRWMERYPTIQHVANATLPEVLKDWEGLGYYSRARFIHEGARHIVEHHAGIFPDTEEAIKNIKGLGPYTMGAIRSFAFHQRTSAVDGNVLRVLARHMAIEDDISQPKTVKFIRTLAESILPEDESWIVNEALIELGATICGRTPRCGECPLKNECQSFHQGKQLLLPIKSKKIVSEPLYRAVAILRYGDRFLVAQGKKGEIMSDLYEFPYFDTEKDGWTEKQFIEELQNRWGIQVVIKDILPNVKHSFTRYRVTLKPVYFHCEHCHEQEGMEWLTLNELQCLAFSSGHRRLLQMLA
jgi:A/G-specific adenine glycosylase